MHVVMIGGTRSIGPYVVQQLAAAGHNVTVYHRGRSEAAVLPPGTRHVHNPTAGIPVLEFSPELLDPRPDLVIHMIAMGEADARAAQEFFQGHARRMLVASSGDVYLAYGRLVGSEPGLPVPVPLHEQSPLRTVLYPYKRKAASSDAIEAFYEKILVERAIMGSEKYAGTVLRLPKIYGPEDNANFASVHTFRSHPQWRWTHGYVEEVGRAIALAAMERRAEGQIYNVGEEYTPTIEERLRDLPSSELPVDESVVFNFAQDIVYDTSKIRSHLGYRERVEYHEGIRRTILARKF
jgi:nucleoside-diphosphate-sugar epimerase